jgi:hypothetical protein
MIKKLATIITALLLPLMVFAVNVSVPQAPGANYLLISTSTGMYIASSTLLNSYLKTVISDSPLGGNGTAGSHLTWTNPGYIMNIAGQDLSTANNAISGFITSAALTNYPSFTYATATYQTKLTNPLTGLSTTSYLAYFSGANAISGLATGTAGYVLQSSSTATGNMVWVATSSLGFPVGGSGTVTSVDMTVPTGLSISGNPINTSGTLALALQTGYIIPLSASTTAWNNFLNASATLPYYMTYGYASSTYASTTWVNATFLTLAASTSLNYQAKGNYLASSSDILTIVKIATSTTGTNWYISTTSNSFTLNIPNSSHTATGVLSNTDWDTFNGKQPAGSYITTELDPVWSGVSGNYQTTATADTKYPSFTYATGTYVNFTYASNTFPSFTYATNTYQFKGNYLSSTTPFTNGYIPYATTSGALTDSNIFTSGLFTGIGNTSPTSVLTVNGSTTLNTGLINWGNTYNISGYENPLNIYGTIPSISANGVGDRNGTNITFYPNQGSGQNNSGDFIFYGGYSANPTVSVDNSYTYISGVKIATTTIVNNSTTNRYLIVSFGFSSNSTTTSSVTYNGVSMTQLSSSTDSSQKTRQEIWGLVAPAVGSNDLVSTFSGTTTPTVIMWSTFNYINQSTPTEYPYSTTSPQIAAYGAITPIASSSQQDLFYVNAVSTSTIGTYISSGVFNPIYGFQGIGTSTINTQVFIGEASYPGSFANQFGYGNSTPFSEGNISLIPSTASTTANTMRTVLNISGKGTSNYLTVYNKTSYPIFSVTPSNTIQLPTIVNSLLQTDASGNVSGISPATYLTTSYMKGGILNTTNLTVANYGTWDGANLWVTNFYSHSISKISSNGTILATYTLASNISPLQLAYDGSSIWVASADTNGRLVKFNPTTGTTTATYIMNPSGLGAGGIQGILYASSTLFIGVSQNGGGAGSGFVATVSTTTGLQIASSSNMTNVNGLTYTNGFIWAANSGFISKINATTMASTSYVTTPDTTTYRITTDGTYIYGADYGSGNIRQWNLSGTLIKTFLGSPSNNAIAFDGTDIWTVGDSGSTGLVTILSTSTGKIINSFPGGSSDIIFDGTYMWGINADNNTVNKFSVNPTPLGSLKINGNLKITGNQILSGALFDSTDNPGTSGLILSSTGTSTKWITPTFSSQWTTNVNDIYFKNDLSGDVGIGTTSPQARLEVYGTSSNDMFRISSSTNARVLTVESDGDLSLIGGNFLLTKTGGQIFLPDNVSPWLPQITFTSDNNTGINRKAADAISFVVGGQEGLVAYLVGGVGGLGVGSIVPTNTKFNITNTGSAVNSMTVSSGGNEDGLYMTIVRATGFTGFGTTTPNAQLTIVNPTPAATTTIAIGSAYNTKAGHLCIWNGTNYTLLYFAPNSITPIYATSTTCK